MNLFDLFRFVLKELCDTEKDYIDDLGLIVNNYISSLQEGTVVMPEALQDKYRVVFGNLEQIYEWHKE